MAPANDVTIYAIDFGTSNSLLAAAGPGGTFAPAPLDESAREPSILRSILYFSEESTWSFGADALRQYVAAGMRGRFLRSLKRFLPMASMVDTRLGSRSVKFEELIGVFLRTMRERANLHYGADVRRVLMGRPARFSEDDAADALAEARLERAARFAGFEEVSFCPEPVAAAYDFRSRLRGSATVLVADLGGGTSDFTVARLGEDGSAQVLAIGGVPVAGDALDGSIMRKKIARHFGADVTYKAPFGENVLTMPRPLIERLCQPADVCLLNRHDTMRSLRDIRSGALGPHDREDLDRLFTLIEDALGFQVFESIEETKRRLSDREKALFSFEYPEVDVHDEITRVEFEAYVEPTTRRILGCLEDTLRAAGLRADQVDLVCATGGTARVPVLSEGLAALFGREKLHQLSSFHAVVQGLAERARALA